MKQRSYTWQGWKEALANRRASAQSLERNDSTVFCWFEDGGEEHHCVIWRGSVPYAIEAQYAQAQNDTDLAEYDARAAGFNRAIDQRTYDGRLTVQPVTAAQGQWHTWHSHGDSATDIGEGTFFGTAHSASGWCEPVVWSYRDPIWISGGRLKYLGAKLGDLVDFVIFAPATPITAASGGNTGNCHLVYGVLIPAAGNGAYNVDLETAVVLPTQSGTGGYWDYTMPTNMRGQGTIAPTAVPGQGGYHLVPARVNLVRFVIKGALLGDGENLYEPANPNPSACLPCWKFECKLYNVDGAHALQAVWRTLNTRYWTTM